MGMKLRNLGNENEITECWEWELWFATLLEIVSRKDRRFFEISSNSPISHILAAMRIEHISFCVDKLMCDKRTSPLNSCSFFFLWKSSKSRPIFSASISAISDEKSKSSKLSIFSRESAIRDFLPARGVLISGIGSSVVRAFLEFFWILRHASLKWAQKLL